MAISLDSFTTKDLDDKEALQSFEDQFGEASVYSTVVTNFDASGKTAQVFVFPESEAGEKQAAEFAAGLRAHVSMRHPGKYTVNYRPIEWDKTVVRIMRQGT